ncbi:hypothetical protein PPL_10451 [Heterostelium album PN500]|uniref:Methyltransferase small domain-containing protein n=1 Tax=Heterostelium pallidum (strain ATCC 26659 / Pp 5 / PN500) TaxID=670386 RepID=D3BR47_HETP5|nr:hypothetical protein PPL_10451 [Heterostelium album PN500]EFA75879.1 hypothetical protein PPL_10451 [Heterostelium album PN500]|eukprot:XP_020428013.1 hypothetical protein PPL_10451 [Heterostelium album PN500]
MLYSICQSSSSSIEYDSSFKLNSKINGTQGFSSEQGTNGVTAPISHDKSSDRDFKKKKMLFKHLGNINFNCQSSSSSSSSSSKINGTQGFSGEQGSNGVAAPIRRRMSGNSNDLPNEPNMSHLGSKDYQNVYEPAQDSFLFIDALKKDVEYLKGLRPLVAVEIGSGSGFVISYLSMLLNNDGYFLSTDINPIAAMTSTRTATHNNVRLDVVNTSFLSGIDRLLGNVDVLLFNPPYVPTPSEEIEQGGIAASWAGGIDGREVIDKLLPQISNILSEKGCFYIVLVEENKPAEVVAIMKKYNFKHKVVGYRQAFNEKLYIVKFYRS